MNDQRVGQVLILFGVCLLLLLTLGVAAQSISLTGGLVFTLLVIVLLPAVVFVRAKGLNPLHGLRVRAVSPRVTIGSLVLGASAWSVAVMIYEVQNYFIGPPPFELGIELETVVSWLIALVIIAVLPGICEEVLFRGAIQGVLERRGAWLAIIVTAILFGLFHIDPWRFLPATFLGIVFGWLTVKSGSIVPAILAHFANNATAVSTSFWLQDAEPWGWILRLALLVVFAATLWFVIRTFRALDVGRGNREGSLATVTGDLPPNPLTTVPAGLPPLVAWGCGITGGLATVLLGLGLFLIYSIVTVVEMNGDHLAPHLRHGDRMVILKRGWLEQEYRPGQTVSWYDGDQLYTDVVTSFVKEEQFLIMGAENKRVRLDQVLGKMITIIPGPRDNEPLESTP